MRIEFKEPQMVYDVDAKTIKGAVEFCVDAESIQGGRYYDNNRLIDDLMNRIAGKLTSIYLHNHSEEVLSRIDLEEIIKRVKIGIIQNVAGK